MPSASPLFFAKVAFKSLVRRPIYFLLIVVLLGIGIGLTVSVYSFSRVVLNPGFPNAGRQRLRWTPCFG